MGGATLPDVRTQDQWRWCNRCYALFYAGFGGGVCAGGAGHDPSGSTAYHAPIDDVPEGAQPGWHWCSRCQSLVYADGDGPCFTGDRHDATGSSEYAVPLESVPSGAQEGWRWCRSCQCLVYDWSEVKGECPGGGTHDTSESRAYSVPTAATVLADVPMTVTVTTQGGWISVAGEGFTPGGEVNLAFIVAGKTYNARTSANEVGRIQHSEDSRIGEGSCLIMVRDEASGDFYPASSGVHHPRALPLDPVLIDHGTEFGEPDDRYE